MKKKKFDKDFVIDQICVVVVLIATIVIMVMAWRVNHPKKTETITNASVMSLDYENNYDDEDYCDDEWCDDEDGRGYVWCDDEKYEDVTSKVTTWEEYIANFVENHNIEVPESDYPEFDKYDREYVEKKGHKIIPRDKFYDGDFDYDMNYKVSLFSETYTGKYALAKDEFYDESGDSKFIVYYVGYLDNLDYGTVNISDVPVAVVDGKFVMCRYVDMDEFKESFLDIC